MRDAVQDQRFDVEIKGLIGEIKHYNDARPRQRD